MFVFFDFSRRHEANEQGTKNPRLLSWQGFALPDQEQA